MTDAFALNPARQLGIVESLGPLQKKIGGRHRARVATSPQVQNRMVEILRMCSFTLSNPDTVAGLAGQLSSKKALSFRRMKSAGYLLSMFLENFTKNWKCVRAVRCVAASVGAR